MTKNKMYAATAMFFAIVAKVGMPFYILESRFQLFIQVREASVLKATGYGIIFGLIAVTFFARNFFRFIDGMRMSYFKGMLVSILEIFPFAFIFFIVRNIQANVEDWLFVSTWLLITFTVGSFFSRLYDYHLQEAREKARMKRYGGF